MSGPMHTEPDLPGEKLELSASSRPLPQGTALLVVREGICNVFVRGIDGERVSSQSRVVQLETGDALPIRSEEDGLMEFRVSGSEDADVIAMDSSRMMAPATIDRISGGLSRVARKLHDRIVTPVDGDQVPIAVEAGASLQVDDGVEVVVADSADCLWMRGDGSDDPFHLVTCSNSIQVRTGTYRVFDMEQAIIEFGMDSVARSMMASCDGIASRLLADENFSFIERVIESTVSDVQVYQQAIENVGRQVSFISDSGVGDATGALDAACRRVAMEFGIQFDSMIRYSPDSARPLVEQFARGAGIQYRKISMGHEWWRSDNGHLLGYLEDDTPIALIWTRKGYVAYRYGPSGQPVSGSVVDAESALDIKPVAVTFYPSLPNRSIGVGDLARLAFRGSHVDLMVLVVATLFISAFGLAAPIFVGIITEFAIPMADRSMMYFIGGGLLLSAVLSALVGVISGLAYLRIETRSSYFALAAMVDRTLKLPSSFYREMNAADMTQRLMAIEQIRTKITQGTIQTLVTFIAGFSYLALMFVYEPFLAMVAIALVGLFILTMSLAGILMSRREYRLSVARSELDGSALDMITSLRQARIQGSINRSVTRVFGQLGTVARELYMSQMFASFLSVLSRTYPIVATAVIFGIYGYRRMSGIEIDLSPAGFLAFYMSLAGFFTCTTMIGMTFATITSVVPMYQRLKPIMEAEPDISDHDRDPGRLSGRIEIKDLTFGYDPSQAPILDGINLHVEPGESIALVGRTGCGKSTLAKLILGLEKPDSGSILFDDTPANVIDSSLLRAQIGVVMQSNQLMPGPIRWTILGVSSDRPLEEAWEAARLAQIDDEIRKMPMGMMTVISPNAVSAGQAQRLLIARALVGDPRILIFDEATSALDGDSQAVISDSIMGLGATRIIIAHRLSTIQYTDRIYVIDEGRIVQTGTFSELSDKPGPFRDLVEDQIL
ncbi:MAG: ATP-binding cassette domain-containing protein [Phycisphaera sp.]|nr:ATP-binding cassette domain-containing protein [Phycisphaera sp.]